ncbi:MAG: inorganic diphosphatase [Candidatus Dojkabacteria bacterium]|nr:MAG: inorganic diphosphatase [Candidatus Dojkabacteria bacterium]
MANISNLDSQYLKTGMNAQHVLPTFDEDGNVNMLVEIPKGSFNKYEYVTEANVIKLDRVLFEMLPYPIEYGLIPQTYDEDNDLLDIMSLVTYPTFPGCLLAVRPIGVMYMNDSGEIDDKVLAVPADDIRFKHITSYTQLPQITIDEIQFFWEHYKDLQFKHKGQTDKKVVIDRWGDEKEALEVIKKCQEAYKVKFA